MTKDEINLKFFFHPKKQAKISQHKLMYLVQILNQIH